MVKARVSRKQKQRSQKQRKQSQKQKQKQRSQKGGSSCSAMPYNRESFGSSQRGGMAPFSSLDNGMLLDRATSVQAEVAPTLDAFAELPTVIRSAQSGGSRSRKSKAKKSRKSKAKKSRKSQKSRKNQKGGEYQAFSADYMLLPKGTPTGANPQFQTEGSVNPLYSEYQGPQH